MSNAPKWDVYQDTVGEWRWRLVAGNGEIVADSAEGYVDYYGVIRALTTVKRLMAETEDVETFPNLAAVEDVVSKDSEPGTVNS